MSNHAGSAQTANEGYPSLWHNQHFLRLLFGRFVTNAGDSLYTVAAMWLVHDITHSTVYTGIASSLLLLPLVLQFISGPIVDRWSIVRSLVTIQVVQAVAILVLPVAAYTGHLSVELLLATIPVLALLNQFVYPAQSAALPQIIADGQLTRANSAFSFANKGVDMLFDALGGLLIALIGATAFFVLNSATFVVSALLFVGIRIPGRADESEEASELDVSGYLADMAEGVRCLRGTVFVEMTFATAVSNLGVGTTFAVLPAFAAVRSGPALYGAMIGALGIGRALGAASASRLEHVKYGHVRVVGFLAGAILWLAAVYTARPSLAVGLFLLAWIPAGISGVMGATLEQTVTPDHLLGRVASFTASASMVTLPIGAVLGGIVGSTIGAINTMAIGGLTFGFVGLYFAVRPRLRRLPAMNDIDPSKFTVGVESPAVPERFD